MKHVTAFAAALALGTLAGPAAAIELYASTPGTFVLQPPMVYAPPVVYVAPRPVVYAPPPVRVFVPAPVATVRVVQTRAVDHDPDADATPERRDPRMSFFIGGGYGGMTAFRGGAAGTYRLHVGLGLGATELGLRADIATRALGELSNSAGGVWLVSAEVAHRFLPWATVRPVIGASFDRWQVEPDGRDSAAAFGVGARAGVEIRVPVTRTGTALVFGLDAAVHRLFAAIDNGQVVPTLLTFGATADLRL